ncbi:dipeptidase [Steroidobacter flavus]|uniref:Dipeptidase n=1 Tax=Steroidobacter flavus TaxID=1842136 RepID=A0ABV8T0B7_9GAMM
MGMIDSNQQAAPAVHELFARSLIWDNHTCTTIRTGRAESVADLQRHRRSGVDVVGLNVGFDAAPPEDTIKLIADFRHWLQAHATDYALVGRFEDIELAKRAGKLAVFFNIEGGNPLFEQASMVSLYYDLGVRWMLFAYNRTNALAGGCQDEDKGLTDLGRAVLEEMQRVGMIVCCSHIGQRSAMEILESARQPVIFSHSNPRAVWEHSRNITDEAMRACAKTGGVVGINGVGIFLGDNDSRAETIVRHIDYAVNLIGAEHVAIGLDYAFDQSEVAAFVKAHPESYPPAKYPNGIELAPPETFPQIAELLLARGYSESAVAAIMGGNLARVARDVWK